MGSRQSVRQGPKDHGQALVEFALVAPMILVLLLLLAVDFGRLFFSYVSVNNAAREDAYQAATRASDHDCDQTLIEFGVTRAALSGANARGADGSLIVSAPTCLEPTTRTTVRCDLAADFACGTGTRVRSSADNRSAPAL